jgi:Mor family transcriptional regulator
MHTKLREHLMQSKPEDIPSSDVSEIARVCGMNVSLEIMEMFGGSSIYIPMLSEMKARVKSFVIGEFNGKNKRDLARICGYSVRTIEKIIAAGKKQGSSK